MSLMTMLATAKRVSITTGLIVRRDGLIGESVRTFFERCATISNSTVHCYHQALYASM